MRPKIPPSYPIVLIILFLLAGFLLGTWFEIIPIQGVYYFLVSFVIGWVVVIICAIVGAVFLGMFFGYRILSMRAFTPFEENVLGMREELGKINERLEAIEAKLPATRAEAAESVSEDTKTRVMKQTSQ